MNRNTDYWADNTLGDYLAAGLLFPEGMICPVVSVSVYYFAAGLLVLEGITVQ
jgi:hypothetical protein